MKSRDLALARRYEAERNTRLSGLDLDSTPIRLWGFKRLYIYCISTDEERAQDNLYQILPIDLGKVYFLLRPGQEWAREFLPSLVSEWEDEHDPTIPKLFRGGFNQSPLCSNPKGQVVIQSHNCHTPLHLPDEGLFDKKLSDTLSQYGLAPIRLAHIKRNSLLELIRQTIFVHSLLSEDPSRSHSE